MQNRIKWLRAGALMLCAASALGATPALAQYFKGKTITVVIGYSPGGTMGVTSRTLTPFLAKHIPGNPNIIVKSMPGGGGLKVLNWLFERAPKDGMTIMYGPTLSIAQLLGQKGIRFDYAKYTLVGGAQTTPIISYARKDVVPGGLKKPEDIMKAKGLKQAGLRPSAWYDLQTRMAIELLGLNQRYTPGYRGGSKIAAAVRSGEANLAGGTLSGYQGAYEKTMGGPNGIVLPLWYFPFTDGKGGYIETPAAAKSNFPTFQSVYEKVKGKAPSGQLWDALNFLVDLRSSGSTDIVAGPPGMNPQAAKILQTAFDKMVKDPAMHAQYKKILGGTIVGVDRARISKALAGISKTDPKMVKFIKDFAYRKEK